MPIGNAQHTFSEWLSLLLATHLEKKLFLASVACGPFKTICPPYRRPRKICRPEKCFGELLYVQITDRILEKIVRAITSGIAAEIVPKILGPQNNSWACFVLSPSLFHAHVAHEQRHTASIYNHHSGRERDRGSLGW